MPREIIVPRDFATINEAIEKAENGDIILVEEGIYVEDLEIRYKNIALKGYPKATIRGQIRIILATVSIENLAIEPNKDVDAIEVISSPITEINNCGIRNAKNGIRVARSHIEIKNTIIENNSKAGIDVEYLSTAEIIKNTIQNNGFHGVVIWGNSLAFIEDNTIQENEYVGILVALGSQAIIKNNRIIKNNGDGISIWGGSSAQVSGNEIADNGGYGLYIRLRSTVAQENSFRDNKFGDIYRDRSSVVS